MTTLARVFKPPFRLIINGPSRTGKTSALRKIVYGLSGQFDKICVNSENALENNAYDFASNLMEGACLDRIMAIIDYQKKRVSKKQPLLKILFIIEDYQSIYGSSKDMSRLFVTARQYQISLVAVTHRLSQVPAMVRDNATHLLITSRPRAKDQTKLIANFTEVSEKELEEAFSKIRLGQPLLLQPRTTDLLFLTVEKAFRTKELDDYRDEEEEEENESEEESEDDDFYE